MGRVELGLVHVTYLSRLSSRDQSGYKQLVEKVAFVEVARELVVSSLARKLEVLGSHPDTAVKRYTVIVRESLAGSKHEVSKLMEKL